MGGVFAFFCFSFLSYTTLALSLDPHFIACKPRHCGNGLNISYPFWFNDQPSYCGHPGFKLVCKNHTPILNMPDNEPYYVHNISYVDHRLLVVNKRLLSDESCSWPTRQATFSRTPFHISNRNIDLFFYFRCPHKLPESIGFYPVHMIECLSNATLYSYTTFANPQILLGPSNYSTACTSWAYEPVLFDGKDGNMNFEISDYQEILRKGFFLEWKADNCTKCVQSGGRCGFDENTSSIICFCPDGPELVTCSTGTPAKKITIEIIIAATAGLGCFFLGGLFFCCVRVSLQNPCRKENELQNVETFLQNYGPLVPRRDRYSQLKKITNYFKDKPVHAGFGNVFKSELSDGRLAAPKALNQSKGNGKEIINEQSDGDVGRKL